MPATPFADPDLVSGPLYATADRLARRTGALHAATIHGDDATTTIVELAARSAPSNAVVADIDVQHVEQAIGRAEITPARSSTAERRFVGAIAIRDGGRRLGRALQSKGRQSAGPLPVWLRIDAPDGFFQFTESATLEWTDRVERVATSVRDNVAGSGTWPGLYFPPVSPYLWARSTRPPRTRRRARQWASDCDASSPHTVRETIVVPLREDVTDQQERWVTAYATEPDRFPKTFRPGLAATRELLGRLNSQPVLPHGFEDGVPAQRGRVILHPTPCTTDDPAESRS